MTLLQDLRFALRSLRRTPGVAAAAIVTLALGIGATSAVYSIANGILWRPLPARDPGRLTVVYGRSEAAQDYVDLSWADYQDLRAQGSAVFEDLMAYGVRPVSLGFTGSAERIWSETVSANYFTLLGTPLSVGRGFVPAEDSAGAPPAVVLSDALWRARFQANPAILGQPVRLNGQQFTVVGVAPAGFQSPFYVGFQPALWIAAGSGWSALGSGDLGERGAVTLRIMGRLRPGVTVDRARTVVQDIVARLAQQYPATNRGLTGALFLESDARPEPDMAPGMRLGFLLFLALSVVVLLVACANVASLLLSRALARRREIAVRLALGAGRGRLVAQLLTEGLVLAVAGGGLGLLVAGGLTDGLLRLLHFATDIPFKLDFSLDTRVVAYTALVTLSTTILFGLVPALQASVPSMAAALKSDATIGGLHKSRLRSALVVGQVALSCLLLTGAGLVLRTFLVMQATSPGFETRNGLLVSVSPGLASYDDVRGRRTLADLLVRLRGLPGVAQATMAQPFPLDFTSEADGFCPEGSERGSGDRPAEGAGTTIIGSEYFRTMGVSLVEGRDFVAGDTLGAPRVVIVSQALAARFWPGQSALGRILHLRKPDGVPLQVVGVVADIKYRQLAEAPAPHVYYPLAQESSSDGALLIRTTGDPLALAPLVRREIAAADAALPIADLKTIDELLAGRAMLLSRVATRITGVLSLLALALALVGLYGVVAYGVAQRTRELGIRLALGATDRGLVRLVVGEGVKLAGLGIALGLVAALGVTRVARSLLVGVSPTDPLVLGTVLGGLALFTLVASWLPARRAGRVTPVVALKSE